MPPTSLTGQLNISLIFLVRIWLVCRTTARLAPYRSGNTGNTISIVQIQSSCFNIIMHNAYSTCEVGILVILYLHVHTNCHHCHWHCILSPWVNHVTSGVTASRPFVTWSLSDLIPKSLGLGTRLCHLAPAWIVQSRQWNGGRTPTWRRPSVRECNHRWSRPPWTSTSGEKGGDRGQ